MDEVGEPSLLEAAQAAIERGDFGEAIAHLEKLCSEEIDETIVRQAQQALVVAYSQGDRLDEAIDLCSWLATDVAANPWAPATLADLKERRERARLEGGHVPEVPDAASQTRLPATIQGPDAGVYEGGRRWRQAGRAKKWKPLKPLARWRFWALQIGTLAVMFGVLRWCSLSLLDFANDRIVHRFPYPLPRYLSWHAGLTWGVGLLLLLAIVASPWWLGWILRRQYDARPLALTKLAARAPEAAKFLQRYCRQRKLARPALLSLPLEHPVAIAYGGPLPGSTRIVLSDGLLERLQDGEIATILASQLSQIIRRDCVLMSAIMGLLQLPYLAYWHLGRWGDRYPRVWQKSIFATLAALFYAIYWLLRVPALWFSRRRLYYSDRFAAEITGDPNALSRALLKIGLGIAAATATQQETHHFLESFDLLLPLAPRQGIGIGSIPPYTPFESVLAWECTNPYRHWLKVFDSHALLGDRLFLLGRYAARWQLPAELDLPVVAPPPKTFAAYLNKLRNSYRALPILQSGVLSGGFLGLLLRGIFWLLGTLGVWLQSASLAWLRTADFISVACLLFAFSLCLIIWINGYFPDIPRTTAETRLPELLAQQKATPPDGQGVCLSGTLLGRPGTANWHSRDLLLQTEDGTIELNFASRFGPCGHLFGRQRPCDFCGQPVKVYGWFRRGATAWIDVDRLILSNRQSFRGGYPWWVTGLALVSAIAGSYIVLQR